MSVFLKYRFVFFIICHLIFFESNLLVSQNEFVNNGSAIFIQPGALVYVQGELVNNDVGANIGLINNNGQIEVRDDWANNSTSGALVVNVGTTVLYGGNQRIKGTQSTKFNNLNLNGTGIKTLDINTYVGGNAGVLNLTSLPLDLNSKTLIITNQSSTAISRTTGYIISETNPIPGYGNIQWDIQNSAGVYTFPFGVSAVEYIPLTMNVATPGVQSTIGSLIASTYPTITAPVLNNRPLPTGVLNLNNNCGTEHAIKMLDRFWVVNPSNYSTNPLTTKDFTYRDSEWDLTLGSSNTIIESNLQTWLYTASWNPILGIGNTATNQYAIASANDYGVFTLGEYKKLDATLLNIDSVICFGQNNGLIQFTSNQGYGSPTYSYNLVSSPDTLNNTLVAGIYTVTVVDVMGCKDTLNDLHVYEPAQLTLTLTSNNYTVCINDQVKLLANFNGGIKPYDLNWSPGILNTGVLTNSSVATYTPNVNTIYSLTVTDKNNCAISNSVSIIVNPLPIIDFSALPLQGCLPLLTNFNNLSALAPVIVSWAWDFGDGLTSTLQNPVHTYTNSGLFNVSLSAVSDKGCINKAVKNSYINVFSLPVANFDYSPIILDYLNPDVNFTNTSTNAGNTVNWFFDDGTTISGNDYPSHSFDAAGTFSVKIVVTNFNNCIDSTILPVIINDISTIYIPNAFTPNGDGLNGTFIPFSLNLLDFKMEIFDRWGAKVFETNDIKVGWDGTFKGAPCKSDVYVYKISYSNLYGRGRRGEKDIVGHVTLLK